MMNIMERLLALILEFWNFYALKENRKNLKISAILLCGSMLGIIFVIPYSLTLQRPYFEKMHLPIPLSILILLQIVQNMFIFIFLILVGLFAAHKAGLGVPLLEAWVEKRQSNLRKVLLISVPLGIVAALLIIGLGYLFSPHMPAPVSGFEEPPAWQGFLASFEGGISEEVMMRLFLMSLLVWMFSLLKKGSWAVWTSIFLASLIFGALHLPTAFMIYNPTTILATAIVVLNGIAGLICGWLYWKHGLEAAMIAHFSADIVLHVIAPLIGGAG